MLTKSIHLPLSNYKKIALAIAVTVVFTACGGSNSGNVPETPKTTPDKPKTIPETPKTTPIASYEMAGDDTSQVSIGQPIGLLAISDLQNTLDSPLFSWKVTSGNANAVKFSASHQPATSLSISEPGEYVVTLYIKANASDSDTAALEKIEKSVTVVADSVSNASLKVDRAAVTGGSVSLYFEPNVEMSAVDDWTLTQVSGTQVKDIKISNDSPFAQVVLPDVTKDEVLAFEAVYTKDPSIKDTAYILVRPNPINGTLFCNSLDDYASCWPVQPLNHHYAYQPASEYADTLVDCVISSKLNDDADFCKVEDLPFIGLDSNMGSVPSVEDIMSRVVVTHDWMGENFERFLREKDSHDDFKKLLRSTTAIIISEDINPAMYLTGTGAIYLEADYLWLTPDERDTVTQTVDFRSGFDSEFDYFFDYDYEKDGQSMYAIGSDYYPVRDIGRSLDTISMNLINVLYHELAHAGDYLSYSHMQEVVKPNYATYKSLHNWQILPDYIASDNLTYLYPLNSEILLDMGNVLYHGREATQTQLNYTGMQIANEYLEDHANDSYSYSSPREDLAMLFEETMMLLRYDMNRYSMVMDRNSSGERPIVIKGERNRIAAEHISDRASFVVGSIMPELQYSVSSMIATTDNVELCAGKTYYEYFNTDCSSVNPYAVSASYNNYAVNSISDSDGRPLGAPKHDKVILQDQRTSPSSIVR